MADESGGKAMKTVAIIGLGVGPEDLTKRHLGLVEGADILIGGKRHLSYFPQWQGEKRVIDKNLAAVIEFIREHMEHKTIVVLASGDPLFFGIGSYLLKKLGRERVTIYPNISSIAAAFARIKESWHDADLLSLHGRSTPGDFCRYFAGKDKVAILTDTTHTPAIVARRLLDCGYDDYRVWILEQLGSGHEQVSHCSLEEAAKMSCSEPNLLILKRPAGEKSKEGVSVYAAMEEDDFVHEQGLITKAEVRTVSLAKLRLESDHLLWDLGAGSGSVSIEASFYVREGRIIAVEKNPARITMIEENREKFAVTNLLIVRCQMPEGLSELPSPDRVFIGGGGPNLPDIIEAAVNRLKSGGRIVCNTVVLENMQAALGTMGRLGLQPEIIQLQVSRGYRLPHGNILKPQNPVWILTGHKKE